MKNGREVKMGKKYEYVTVDCKRILMVHNVTEEDLGIYECVLADDRMSLQLTLKGTIIKIQMKFWVLFCHRKNSLTAIAIVSKCLKKMLSMFEAYVLLIIIYILFVSVVL